LAWDACTLGDVHQSRQGAARAALLPGHPRVRLRAADVARAAAWALARRGASFVSFSPYLNSSLHALGLGLGLGLGTTHGDVKGRRESRSHRRPRVQNH